MGYYEDVYLKRTNRFGNNLQDRLENARRRNFEAFLTQSPHYTTFWYKRTKIDCVFEPMRQNETKTMMHVLVKADQELDIGYVITINKRKYLVYYWDERRNSGYNRYVVLLLTHLVTWYHQPNGKKYHRLAYLYFQQNNMLKNELKSRSRMDTLYLENLKLNFLVMATTDKIKIADYVVITTTGITQYFRVTGFDLVSTPGIMYISIDPTAERNLAPLVETDNDTNAEMFWFRGFDVDTTPSLDPEEEE